MPAAWKTLFLPKNFPKSQDLCNYLFGHNDTHAALVLDYGSIFNHHEDANVHAVTTSRVRMGFVCGNCTVPKMCSMHACTHTQRIHEQMNTFKATKDIVAGQEILVRYGSVEWFVSKNIPYSDVDYARTMWRPELHPIPCRQDVHIATGADGRHCVSVLAKLPSDAVLDISLCLKVPVVVVDQYPVLWDYVLNGAIAQTVCACKDAQVCCQPSILIRTNISLSNPTDMSPSIIRRANPDHTQS